MPSEPATGIYAANVQARVAEEAAEHEPGEHEVTGF
jgi:hypothetical protein